LSCIAVPLLEPAAKRAGSTRSACPVAAAGGRAIPGAFPGRASAPSATPERHCFRGWEGHYEGVGVARGRGPGLHATTYVHLLDGGLGDADFLDRAVGSSAPAATHAGPLGARDPSRSDRRRPGSGYRPPAPRGRASASSGQSDGRACGRRSSCSYGQRMGNTRPGEGRERSGRGCGRMRGIERKLGTAATVRKASSDLIRKRSLVRVQDRPFPCARSGHDGSQRTEQIR
jgi:hypothetical protein